MVFSNCPSEYFYVPTVNLRSCDTFNLKQLTKSFTFKLKNFKILDFLTNIKNTRRSLYNNHYYKQSHQRL